jgi:hypothetical protein
VQGCPRVLLSCSEVTHEVCKGVSRECVDVPMQLGNDMMNKMVDKMGEEIANVQISFPDLRTRSDSVELRGPEKEIDDHSKYSTNSGYQVKIPIVQQSSGGSEMKLIPRSANLT